MCLYCITSSSNFTMLHNVNLNIINLNALTHCLSICNRMAPPTPHQLYPSLRWSTTTPFFHWTMRFSRGVRGILTFLGLSLLHQTYVERIIENLQTHKPMKLLCGNLLSIYLLRVCFNLRTVDAALVVLHSTDNISIETGRCLSVSLPRRCLWPSTDAPCTMARH